MTCAGPNLQYSVAMAGPDVLARIGVVEDHAEQLAELAASRPGNPRLRVLSLGGGVQSATLSLLVQRGGFVPRPDVAVFADTGWERDRTLEMVAWIASAVDWPVVRVTATRRDGSEANIRDDLMAGRNSTGQPFVAVPQFTVDHSDGSRGMGRRQCTREYKVDPILHGVRRLLGVAPRGRVKQGWSVETWSGLSTDEYWRLKPRRVRWERQRQPLMEMGMTRSDCVLYWNAHAPASAPVLGRSSCIGCPFHAAGDWTELAREMPEALRDAAEVEKAMNDSCHRLTGVDHIDNFLHRRRVPLLEAVSQDMSGQPWDAADGEGGFNEECEGICAL